MEIKVSTENGRVPVTIVHVDGNLDSATYQSFQSKADEFIKDGARFMLVDLTHAPYLSSAGLRALHHIFEELRKIHPDENLSEEDVRKGIIAGTYKSPHLKLLNLSTESKTAFELGGFDLYIETFTDLKKAVSSF
jgi:anti-anti-sigma factor